MTLVFAAVLVALGSVFQEKEPPSASPGSGQGSRPAPCSALSGVVLWKGEVPKAGEDAGGGEACIVGTGGRLAHAAVLLVPLDGQDLSRLPPPQVRSGEPTSRIAAYADGADVQVRTNPALPLPRVVVWKASELPQDPKQGALSWGVHLMSPDGAAGEITLLKNTRPRVFRHARITRVFDAVRPAWVGYSLAVERGEHRVTGTDGAFRFDGLPPGRYEVSVWHESGRNLVREAVLEAGKPMKLELELR